MPRKCILIFLAAAGLQLLIWETVADRLEKINIHREHRDSKDLFKKRRSHMRNIADSSECETKECTTVGKMILDALNNSTDPCEDFYEFACGGFAAKNILPRNEAIWNWKTMVKLSLQKRLIEILERKSRFDDVAPVKMARRWYSSCMDFEKLEERGILPLKSLITTVGGWPIIMEPGEWNSEEFSWQQVEQYYSRFTGSFILYSINAPLKSTKISNCNEITMTQPKLPLSENLPYPRMQIELEEVEAYSRLITRVAYSFVQENRARISKYRIVKDVKDIVDFEIALSQIIPKFDNYALVSVGDIQKAYEMEERRSFTSNIDFRQLIQSYLEFGNVRTNSSQLVNFRYEYFRDLISLLDETPARTIVNYVHWHFVSRTMSFTNRKMREILWDYTKETFGVEEEKPRSYQCLNEMKMRHALGYEYSRKHFSKRLKNGVNEIVREIKNGFGPQIWESNWMSDELKLDINKKIRSTEILIGAPDWYLNPRKIIHYYEELIVGPDYFDNNLNHWRFDAKKKIEAWQGIDPNGINKWIIDPLAEDPIYVDVSNEINLPLVNIQWPLFTSELPEAFNYAVAGFNIAEQIAHGFDRTGRLFDTQGNITEWPELMIEAYNNSSECFVEQFNSYEINFQDAGNYTNVTEIGNKTLDENIADSIGIEAAFLAYKFAIIPRDSTDRKLPGLEKYTNEQLFFLIYANTMCETATAQLLSKKIQNDSHSPSRLRIIGTMSNSNSFSRAFQCSAESQMNPLNKCSIWQKSMKNYADQRWFNAKN